MNKEKLHYLDLLAVQEYVDDLARYCEQQYLNLQKKIELDKQKNEQLRYDYQEYEYEGYFDTSFKIHVYDGSTRFSDFDDVESWKSAYSNGSLPELKYVEIILGLCWRTGKKSGTMVEHVHKFKVHLEPNASYFECEFGDTDEDCRDVRQDIINKLEGFPAIRTIFSKDEQ